MPNASSCMLVLPMMMAPALNNASNDGAFVRGCTPCRAGVPPEVGRSIVLMLSLMTTGRPASGPLLPSSTSAAVARAPSLLRKMKAFRSFNCSARSMAALVTAVAVIFLARMAAMISAADDGIDWAVAELTCAREGSAAPTAAAADDVRMSRREMSLVMLCSQTMLSNLVLRPLVEDAFSFAERTLQRFGRHDPDLRADADRILDEGGNLLGLNGETAAVPAFRPRFGQHGHLVHAALARQLDDEMAAAPVGGEQRLLDLGREYVDAAQDDHVVATPGDFLHAPH